MKRTAIAVGVALALLLPGCSKDTPTKAGWTSARLEQSIQGAVQDGVSEDAARCVMTLTAQHYTFAQYESGESFAYSMDQLGGCL